MEWEDFAIAIDTMIANIDFPVKTVVGIARGGVVPALVLAQRLEAKFEVVTWQTRDGLQQDHIKAMELNDPTTLFIDDLVDSGLTIESLRELAPDSKFGTIHSKTEEVMLDICAYPMYNDGTWILYPWEFKL